MLGQRPLTQGGRRTVATHAGMAARRVGSPDHGARAATRHHQRAPRACALRGPSSPLRGGAVSVEVDVNAKTNFESGYWKGILDAQGKTDGGYY